MKQCIFSNGNVNIVCVCLKRLAQWVAVQSVSAWPEKRGEIKKMMEMAAKDIERLGGTVEMADLGMQKVCFLKFTVTINHLLWSRLSNFYVLCSCLAS